MTETEPAFERTVVLGDDAELAAIKATASEAGWPITYTNHGNHSEYEQILWTTSSGQTRVRYLEHHTTGTRFLSIYGDDVDEAVATVGGATNVITIDQILDELLAEPAPAAVDLVRGFRKLGIAHYVTRVHAHNPGEMDPRYLTAVAKHVAHEHRQVRLSVMLVADELSALWPQITAPIVARQGQESELAELVDAFVDVAASRG